MRVLGVGGRALTPSLYNTGSETDDPKPTIGDFKQQQQQQQQYRHNVDEASPGPQDQKSSRTFPSLQQRLRHHSSILSIVISDRCIYAGTQTGEILVYALGTFEQVAIIEAHRSSVLALCLSQDQSLLFSSAGDRKVNVWNTRTLKRKCCLISSFDVGDIFCVAFSAALQTLYLGAQNTTIQWCAIAQAWPATPGGSLLPLRIDDPFFDSKGPGGVKSPRPLDADVAPRHAQGGSIIEIGKQNVKHFAHYGYVYCMLLAKDGVPESLGQEVLVTGGGDGIIKLWRLDAENGGALEELFVLDDGREEGHPILSIAMDGNLLYSSRLGGEVDVWDLETRQLVRNFRADREDALTISVGGGFVFAAAVTGYIRKFDRHYQLQSKTKAHEGRILASAYKHHARRAIYVTGSNDNTVGIWDVTDCSNAYVSPSKTSNEQLVDYLRKFVSYRTVSSDPRFKVDCRRGASYLKTVFKNFGASTEMLPTEDPCNPVILARFRGNPTTASQRKKILFYGHYDVVAAKNDHGKWLNDPFEMEGIDGYLYGRGTSDNKGPIMAAIFACAELADEQALGSDIIFLIEGEEECGSRGFENTVHAFKDRIGEVDWILLANSYWLDDRIPCLTYGLRGVIHATVQIESSHPDLHSGVDGSAQLDEPLKDLVMLLGRLTGKNGRVNIPHFYDPVLDITKQEAELYAEITTALLERNPELGDARTLEESLMRKWRDASLTIHRFQTSGPDNATIIPRMAKAALSLRLVPNQEAQDVKQSLISFLEDEFKKLQSDNRLSVTIDHQAEAWLGDPNNEIFQTLEEAIVETWGPLIQIPSDRGASPTSAAPSQGFGASSAGSFKPAPATSSLLASGGSIASANPGQRSNLESQQLPLTPMSEVVRKLEGITTDGLCDSATPRPQSSSKRQKPLYIREGGSIPAIRFLEKEFDAPAAHFPCGQASDSAHLDNERLRLVNLYKSKDILKKVFRELPKK